MQAARACISVHVASSFQWRNLLRAHMSTYRDAYRTCSAVTVSLILHVLGAYATPLQRFLAVT
eukprot:17483-Eustigmatos_ZCMA.PRE.1